MSERFDNEQEQELVRDIKSLPGAISPRRDLWPGIEARLEPRAAEAPQSRFSWRRHAIAASVLAAFTVGILLGRQAPDVAPIEDGMANNLPAVAVQGVLAASEREYQAAFQAFTPVGMDPNWMDTQAVQGLETTWDELQEAEGALLDALAEHPDNRFLSEKLMDLRAQQLEFMRQMHMLDQNSRRNT